MNTINSFTIDTSDMSTDAGERRFQVNGSVGSKFLIVALQDATQKYYNFSSQAFEDGHDATKNLVITMSKSVYRNNFSIPAGGGDFVIKLIPLEDTIINSGKSNALTRKISKTASNTTLTFQFYYLKILVLTLLQF